MGAHLIDGEFQSDKYPTCPRGKVPLSVTDVTAQDLLWAYAERRRVVDAEFSEDLQQALRLAGYTPLHVLRTADVTPEQVEQFAKDWSTAGRGELLPVRAAPDAFVIGNAGRTGWRALGDFGFSTWTDDVDAALQFARRRDAEAFAAEDEDAWCILTVNEAVAAALPAAPSEGKG